MALLISRHFPAEVNTNPGSTAAEPPKYPEYTGHTHPDLTDFPDNQEEIYSPSSHTTL